MRYLILSDNHGNLEALEAVLAALPSSRYDAALVLGDLVGYGADPNAVIDRVRALAPLATIVGHSTHAQEPGWFTTAPVGAMEKLFQRTGWKAKDVDLYEINEAFAVVTMAAMQEHGLPHDKVNVHGGACALGHPIGASGARIVVTLLGALRKRGLKRGVASLCIGGGEATAMAVELA